MKKQHDTQTSSQEEPTSFEDLEQDSIVQAEFDQESVPESSAFFTRFDLSTLWKSIKQSYLSRVILVLFAIWFGFKLLAKLMPSRPKSPPTQTTTTSLINHTHSKNQDKIMEEENMDQPSLDLHQENAQTVSPSTTSPELVTRLAKIQASLDQLTLQLTGLQNKYTHLERQVNQVRDSLQPVYQWYQKQLKVLDEMAKKGISANTKSPRQILYNLRSIQAGRAWISTQNGEEITVQVGDIIPGYGTVSMIDSINKLVKLSNGVMFGFSNNPALDDMVSST